ncbi:hypothetical protein KJ644_01025 [Candidatus Dependentiae bacterium]|nr:hypothetical protein [Candidatus Dependentiae bacterium]MBU4387032.1 hypothetical protein [Candidatus Dependentiae bacterium]MCG2756700.1 hypothetical protein [Candidatus Dependentiae bacterium]
MASLLYHKFCKKIIISIFIFASTIILSNAQESILTKIINDTLAKYNIENKNSFYGNQLTPTTAHIINLKEPMFNFLNLDYVASSLNETINSIGISTIESILNDALNKELKFKDNSFVFYHAQDRVFLLYQDLCKKIYKKIYKESINSFILLRIPNKESKKYKNVMEFLNKFKYNINDDYDDIRTLILSVNPSLFGNTVYDPSGESSFEYFLTSSNANYTNHMMLIKNIFENFEIQNLYTKYLEKLHDIYYLLSGYEDDMTGILLQIFIPKEIVNNFVYKSKPWGIPFDLNCNVSSHLNIYNSQKTFSDKEDEAEFDQIQYRILINDELMKNKSAKIFRYLNKNTPNIITYKMKFKNLIKKIEEEISATQIKDKSILKFPIDMVKKTFEKITEKLKS